MRRPRHNTTSLPRQLRDELGIADGHASNKRRRTAHISRKEQRRARRKRGQVRDASPLELNEEDEEEDNDMDELAEPKRTKARIGQDDVQDDDEEDEEDESSRRISRTARDGLAQDDAEIAALEKKLGLKKGKKLPSSFAEDGLAELLGELDSGGSDDERRRRKMETDEWLGNKRRKGEARDAQQDESEGMSGSEEDEDDFEGFDGPPQPKAKRKRENPYVAPVPAGGSGPKYVPPSLRRITNPEPESLTRLRRQAQGHLNKLAESNLISILSEIEKLYREYPRHSVTSTLISLLLGLVCERTALQDTFMILHAGFIAAMYKTIGVDFGAFLVQNMVERFDADGDDRGSFQGKELVNLISLLSHLYNFHVVGSALVFDYIRLFLQEITEANTELLLKIIKSEYLSSVPLMCRSNRQQTLVHSFGRMIHLP